MGVIRYLYKCPYVLISMCLTCAEHCGQKPTLPYKTEAKTEAKPKMCSAKQTEHKRQIHLQLRLVQLVKLSIQKAIKKKKMSRKLFILT